MTDRDTLLLRNETGAFIPAQEPLSLSGYSVQLDSVYSLRMIRLKETENAFEYKEVEQCYKGNPYIRLKGYFALRPIQSPLGPMPGLYPVFVSDEEDFRLSGFGNPNSMPYLGGILRDCYTPQVLCDVLFIKTDEGRFVPYKLFSKTSVSLSEISMPDISIADRGRGSCEIQSSISQGEISIFSLSGTLLSRYSIENGHAFVSDLPCKEVLVLVFQTTTTQITFKTILQ